MRTTDRAVLVTGASRGVGRAVARAFASQGDRVAVHYRNSAALAQVVLRILGAPGNPGIAATARNWSTSTKLLSLSEET